MVTKKRGEMNKTKKKAISIKLRPALIEWMDRQPEKRPELIETALKNYYQIPDFNTLE